MDGTALGIIITITFGYLGAIWYFTRMVTASIDVLRDDVREFKTFNHADMQAHTQAIADLRDRVGKLEKDA